MNPVLARCGYRCDLCLAYKPNVLRNPANQQKLSDGWFKYFGFRIPPEEILCEGCLSIRPHLIDESCPVRPCVLEKGLKSCAQCGQYICDHLAERLVIYEEVRENFGDEIPEDDYLLFIQPYENKKRLDAIRDGRS